MICNICNLPMKERDGKYGRFWGCTGYPNCKNVVRIEGAPQAVQEKTFTQSQPILAPNESLVLGKAILDKLTSIEKILLKDKIGTLPHEEKEDITF